jgi:hypothetical protein
LLYLVQDYDKEKEWKPRVESSFFKDIFISPVAEIGTKKLFTKRYFLFGLAKREFFQKRGINQRLNFLRRM